LAGAEIKIKSVFLASCIKNLMTGAGEHFHI
jgi:hypothetical protein